MSKELYKNVSVNDFKDYFKRDFPYLPAYNSSKTYQKGDVVYYNGKFYESLDANNTALPTDTEKWGASSDTIDNYINDDDITKAMSQALIAINEKFGSCDCEKIVLYMHLVAYYLVLDLHNASQGIGSAYSGPVQSKSVGDVSESYAIPTWLTNNPMYSMYMANGYGQKYLSLIAPELAVTLLFSYGRTTFG